MNGYDKQNSGPRTFESTKKGKNIHTRNSTIGLKNEDDISEFLVQAFSKGRGGKPFTQIREVYKKALSNMEETSRAQSRVFSATLGHFLMAPVKCVEVDDGRVLGSTSHEKEKDNFVLHQITFGQDMSKKGGMYTDRIKLLPLDFLTRVIENVYKSEKVRYLE